jgi:hypothetical protein
MTEDDYKAKISQLERRYAKLYFKLTDNLSRDVNDQDQIRFMLIYAMTMFGHENVDKAIKAVTSEVRRGKMINVSKRTIDTLTKQCDALHGHLRYPIKTFDLQPKKKQC